MVDQSQVDAVSGVKGLEGESIAPGEVDAGDALKVPVYSDNANAVQESESVWFNDGSGPNPSGYYGFDGGSIFGPFGDVHNPLTGTLDAGSNDITNIATATMDDRSVTNVGAKAYATTDQTAQDQTYTKIQYDSTYFNDDSVWDTANYKFVAPSRGAYLVQASCTFKKIEDGTSMVLRANNSGGTPAKNWTQTGKNDRTTVNISTVFRLSAGDEVDFEVWQDSGFARDIYGNGVRTYAEVAKLG